MPLEPPAEFLSLGDGESVAFHVLRWEAGTTLIRPARRPGTIEVPALRLWLPEGEKLTGAPYWDLTAQTTINRLLPLLPGIVAGSRLLTLTRYGEPPAARDQVAIGPAES